MYRGVDWVHIPTTLLAQGDSCIGSKTSINFGKFKNQLGNFFSPKQIFIDVNFLKTLDKADLISGLGEMAHYFLVSSCEDFLYFKSEYHNAQNNLNILKDLIIRSLEIKKSYIEIDEFDQNERQVFNYGHSFGHALESLTNYRIPHGIAVSIGMDMSNFMSVKYGYMTEEARQEIRLLLKQVWVGYSIDDIDLKDMENAITNPYLL
jgi:3-dehydroquinate synthase